MTLAGHDHSTTVAEDTLNEVILVEKRQLSKHVARAEVHSADHLIVVWIDHHQLVERARDELMAVFRIAYSLAVLERELNVGRLTYLQLS